jgi:hypothetical protein
MQDQRPEINSRHGRRRAVAVAAIGAALYLIARSKGRARQSGDVSPARTLPAPRRPDLRLTASEDRVLRALAAREASSEYPRLAAAYKRMLELARSGDPVDAVLAAHLAREVLSALPAALGVVLSRTRLQYENRLDELAERWPSEVRASDPPEPAVAALRALLSDHEAASSRARQGPRQLWSVRTERSLDTCRSRHSTVGQN